MASIGDGEMARSPAFEENAALQGSEVARNFDVDLEGDVAGTCGRRQADSDEFSRKEVP